MTGPVRAKGAAQVYINPVHCPSFACFEVEGPRMFATEAGGRPMTAPDTAPKRMTNASAWPSLVETVQRQRMSTEDTAVTIQWTFRAP